MAVPGIELLKHIFRLSDDEAAVCSLSPTRLEIFQEYFGNGGVLLFSLIKSTLAEQSESASLS